MRRPPSPRDGPGAMLAEPGIERDGPVVTPTLNDREWRNARDARTA